MCGRNAIDFHPTKFKKEWLIKLSKLFSHSEEVTLMGWGEPTVHPQFVDILRYLTQFPLKKYICTNGMKLRELTPIIFETHVDILAVSLDGANPETNDRIRKGASFNEIVDSLKQIVNIRNERGIKYPYINFVFTAMKDNYTQIPDMVELAARIGIEEVKVVYFTSFKDDLDCQSLKDMQNELKQIFADASRKAEMYNIMLKLPYIQGEDPAGAELHRPCYMGWRDLFIGSDGYIRPCMSTPIKFVHIDTIDSVENLWNSTDYESFRKIVNDSKLMPESCKRCYQSSVANWNLDTSFIQTGSVFSPEWSDE